MLTQEQVQGLLEYRDGQLYWKVFRNGRTPAGKRAGTMHGAYMAVSIDDKKYMIHRVIFLLHHGYLPPEVDHINGDKLDNRVENLRAATKSQNQHNRGAYKNNTSGYKGVSWIPKLKKWFAYTRVNGKQIRVGWFVDKEEANQAAIAAREKLHGEFCRHK